MCSFPYRSTGSWRLNSDLDSTVNLCADIMSDHALNESAVAEQSQVHEVDLALPPATSSSEKLLRRIASLLFILVAGLLTVFGYYASSLCITVVLAAFLAILFDPVVVLLEKPCESFRPSYLWYQVLRVHK